MSKVHVILPVHNRVNITRYCVESLHSQINREMINLILIDDGCIDETVSMVCGFFPNTTVIQGDGNLWWGGALQKGYEWLRDQSFDPHDYVLILNDDTTFSKDFLKKGFSCLREKTLLLARAFDLETKKEIDRGIRINWLNFSFNDVSETEKPNCLSTRGLLMNYSDFLSVGGFRPDKLPHYCSDYEFTVRAFKKGLVLESHESFSLYVDESTTGVHYITTKNPIDYVKNLMTTKSAKNPMMLSRFVLMCAPKIMIPFSLARIWLGVVARYFTVLLKRKGNV